MNGGKNNVEYVLRSVGQVVNFQPPGDSHLPSRFCHLVTSHLGLLIEIRDQRPVLRRNTMLSKQQLEYVGQTGEMDVPSLPWLR